MKSVAQVLRSTAVWGVAFGLMVVLLGAWESPGARSAPPAATDDRARLDTLGSPQQIVGVRAQDRTTSPEAPLEVDGDENWYRGFFAPHADIRFKSIRAIAFVGKVMYVGGDFRQLGGVDMNGIARWDGVSWHALGNGVGEEGIVTALAVHGADLYVGGYFGEAGTITASHVAKYDTVSGAWSALGEGITDLPFDGLDPVQALAIGGTTLYVGGRFDIAGGIPAKNIAAWDILSRRWSKVGVVGTNDLVNALAATPELVYIGGSFTEADFAPAKGIAVWDNGIPFISELGGGIGGAGSLNVVNSLLLHEGGLYVGGDFEQAGNVTTRNLAFWAAGEPVPSWFTWGDVSGGPVYALKADGQRVYVAGAFTSAGGVKADRVARWTGLQWEQLGLGQYAPPLDTGGIYALGVNPDGTLFVGGDFTYVGDSPNSPKSIYAPRIARWENGMWHALGNGLGCGPGCPGTVTAMANSYPYLYVAGRFKTAGGVQANNVARWDGRNWEALGSGIPLPPPSDLYNVYAIAVDGPRVFFGGRFEQAGNVLANNVAEWNTLTDQWSNMGGGIAGPVSGLAVSGGTLYAGGAFSQAGGTESYYIAQWNGGSWSTINDYDQNGLQGPAGNMRTVGDSVYMIIGGCALNDAQTASCGVAKWGLGGMWGSIGGVPDLDYVYALAAGPGGKLYVAGRFDKMFDDVNQVDPPTTITNVASWDGSHWSPLGQGLGVPGDGVPGILLQAIAVHMDDVYVAGNFDTVGNNVPAHVIATWNGSEWLGLGSGLSHQPAVLEGFSGGLYGGLFAGGGFHTAGDIPSAGIAAWKVSYIEAPAVPGITSIYSNAYGSFSLTIPPGSVPITRRVAFPLGPSDFDPGDTWPDRAYPLFRWRMEYSELNGTLIPTIPVSYTLKIPLGQFGVDMQARGIQTDTLRVLRRGDAGWTSICQKCLLDPANAILTLEHNHFSDFALVGDVPETPYIPLQDVFMPAVGK